MLTLSKPLSAAQARAYHAEEFSNAHENYYTAADQIRGQQSVDALQVSNVRHRVYHRRASPARR